MAIRIEFYGIPRARAGVAETTAVGARLGDVLADLEARFPGLADGCIENGRLRPGFMANLDGRQFTTDPDCDLTEFKSVLILSADAGGC
jgi:molybdopterin converting factor small subunit